ncbi:MAG: hypothetical protein Q9195_000432 [Heterodermia aff. obscurata]
MWASAASKARVLFFMGKDGRYARGGRERALHVLLEAGADPNIELQNDVGNFSPLDLALNGGSRESVRYLLQKGAIVGDFLINKLLDKLHHETDFSEDNDAQYVIEHAQKLFISEETRTRALHQRAQASIIPALSPASNRSTSGGQNSKRDNEVSLLAAVQYGQLEVIIRLLDEYHVDVNAVEKSTRFTTLHYASKRDQLEIVQVLIDRGADPLKADGKGRTALHHSVETGTRCLEFYLQHNYDTTVTDEEYRTVWHLAALHKNIGALRTLIHRSDSKVPPLSLQRSSELSLIACASISGSIEAVSILLDAGCSVSDLDSEGWTPLHHAARVSSLETVRLLIARGANTRAITDDGSSIVHCAIMGACSRLDELLDILLSTGINPFNARRDGITPMELLISEGLDEKNYRMDEVLLGKVLRRLSSLPISSEEKQNSFQQALKFICQAKPSLRSPWLLSVFKALLENGADLMSTTSDGKSAFGSLLDGWRDECLMQENLALGTNPSTPLKIATEMVLSALDHIPPEGPPQDLCTVPSLLRSALALSNDALIFKHLIYKLLEYSPDVDKNFDDGHDSPIRYACRNGCSPLVLEKLLARSKASSDAAFGSDLVREACRDSSVNSNANLLTLLDSGVDCNGHSLQGETALMYAAGAGNVDMVNILLAHGSDAKARDHNGRTVGHYACRSGWPQVLVVLRNYIDWNATASVVIKGRRRQNITVLHLAATHDGDLMLKFLLNEELIKDIDAVTDFNETALAWATWLDRPRNVSLLLRKNADTASMNAQGDSPIHIAVCLGYVEVMSEFMNHGCNLRIPNREGLDCEILAWKYGHTGLAMKIGGHFRGRTSRALIVTTEAPARDPITTSASAEPPKTRVGASQPLKSAIDLGNLDICRRIIQEGVDLDAGYSDCDGCTAFLYCLHRQKPKIAEHIALRGGSPLGKVCRHYNPHGYSAFHLAASRNYSGLLKILLELQPSQYRNLKHPEHPLHLAVLSQAAECVDLMLCHAENEDLLASPSLYNCTKKAIHQLVNLRVCAGPTGSVTSARYGETPLTIAAKSEAIKITRRLLEAGALVDLTNFAHETPLHIAAQNRGVGTIEVLLGFGANFRARDYWLRTPAMLAAEQGHLETLLMLSRNGLDLDEVDAGGNSIFHNAAYSGTSEGLTYLMSSSKGDLLGKANKLGDSALSVAFATLRDNLPMILNIQPSQEACHPERGNILSSAVANQSMTGSMMKMVLKRVPREILSHLLAHQDRAFGTPLYASSTIAVLPSQNAIIDLLLAAGADLELKGGDAGTPLIGACAAGRLGAVKHLVRKGARISYVEDGKVISALRAAKHFPDIVRWLLVGRFLDGPKLLTG